MVTKETKKQELISGLISKNQIDFENSLAQSLRLQTVKVLRMNPLEVLQQLEGNHNVEVESSVRKSILENSIPVLNTRQDITLVHFEVGKVFPFGNLSLGELEKRAFDCGLVRSPANVIEDINLYKKSSLNVRQDLIMEPIINHAGFPIVFSYGRYDLEGKENAIEAVGENGLKKRMWLGYTFYDSKTLLYPDQRVTFALPPKK